MKLNTMENSTNIQSNENGYFLIDLKDKAAMQLYYSLKERFEYRLENRDEAISHIAQQIKPLVQQYEQILIPESSNDFLLKLTQALGVQTNVIKKNKIENVIAFFETLPLQKKERLSHLERLQSMGPVFKINLMKSTQRRKYEAVIFENVSHETKHTLVIDDSCFSGTTLNGIKSVVPQFDFLAIFSK